jgi:hypothetical protein
MHLYDDSKFYSALHLASAAEEILGKLVDYLTDTPSDSVKEGFALREQIIVERDVSAIFQEKAKTLDEIRADIVLPKNYVKHHSKPTEETLNRDPQRVARDYLLRAISNLNILLDDSGDDIERFEDSLLEEEEADFVTI